MARKPDALGQNSVDNQLVAKLSEASADWYAVCVRFHCALRSARFEIQSSLIQGELKWQR
jgi:hypothetical protein